jgi:acyl carrier protein
MDHQDIFNEVKSIFRRIISENVEVQPETSSRDVHSWDSLNHVLFIAEVEKIFDIRFDLSDMLEMRSIADICKGIDKQLHLK